MMHFYRLSLLFIIFLIFTFIPGHSQTIFGIKGGINASKASFTPETENLNYILRYHAGAFAELQINKRIFLKPEVLYSIKGWNKTNSNYKNGVDVNLHYLNVPLLAGYKINKYVSLSTGPEFGYLLNTTGNFEEGKENIFQNFDIGYSLGASFNFASKFGIELRYIHGFNGLIDRSWITNQFGESVFNTDKIGRNKVFQISTRYRFSN